MARRGMYNYVIESTFQPYSFQDYLAPFAIYKDAYEKVDKELTELSKAELFNYLDENIEEGSKARSIFDKYAKDLRKQTKTFLKEGLSPGVRTGISSLQKRYAGEIGRLEAADKALKEVQKTRDALRASGKYMLYANNNPSIDDFLGGKQPNMYGVSVDELFAKGAQQGKAISSRMYDTRDGGSVLGGYYRMLKQATGIPEQAIAQFMQSKPFNDMIDSMLFESGALENLKGNDLLKARQSLISGFYNGIVYSEKNDVQRDLGVSTPSELDTMRRGWASLEMQKQELANKQQDRMLSLWTQGITQDENGNLVYNPENSIEYKKALAIQALKNGSGKSSSNGKYPINKKGMRIKWGGDDPASSEDEYLDYEIEDIDDKDSKKSEHEGISYTYDQLPDYAKRAVQETIGPRGDFDEYYYNFVPFKRSFLNDTEPILEIIPRNVNTDANNSGPDFSSVYGAVPGV